MKRFLCIILVLFIYSCNDEDFTGSKELYGKWTAIHFISVESVAYPKMDDYNPTIEFYEDSTYALQLDRNGCGGEYTFSNNNELDMSVIFCTEICCDSDFSKKFSSMLPAVSSFTILNNKLKLNVSGWGYIELQRE